MTQDERRDWILVVGASCIISWTVIIWGAVVYEHLLR